MQVTEIMTQNPRTIRAIDRVGEALDTLQSMAIRHLPVLDEDGELIGMLSDRDFGPLMRIFTDGPTAAVPLSLRRVAEFMSGDVVSVGTDADVREAIARMLEERISAVPVVDAEGHLVGIVSYVDILRSMSASAP